MYKYKVMKILDVMIWTKDCVTDIICLILV